MSNIIEDNFMWSELYRPHKIEDCILPKRIKDSFLEFIKKGSHPNLLLCGPPGIGKTTVAKALCKELDLSYYFINGSDEGRFLDTVRNQVKSFASTVSLYGDGKYKVIIIDEADNTGKDVQLLLRSNIEAFHSNCRFIFTCNYKNKIIEPIQSRCSVVDFSFSTKEKNIMAADFFKLLKKILDERTIEYDQKVLVTLITNFFPDFRRILNECERYSVSGKIDTGIFSLDDNLNFSDLIANLKQKNFNEVRKWVVNHIDNDAQVLLRKLYDTLYNQLDGPSIAAAVLIIAKYQYQAAFCADQEINLLAALTEIMCECNFK